MINIKSCSQLNRTLDQKVLSFFAAGIYNVKIKLSESEKQLEADNNALIIKPGTGVDYDIINPTEWKLRHRYLLAYIFCMDDDVFPIYRSKNGFCGKVFYK